jgi:prophage antirepressor-like protein
MTKTYYYDGQTIRMINRNGTPWFVGKDVATILGYRNYRRTISRHIDDEDKGHESVSTGADQQIMTVIDVFAIYKLIRLSKSPRAPQFKHWVTNVMLPDARREIEVQGLLTEMATYNDWLFHHLMPGRNERLDMKTFRFIPCEDCHNYLGGDQV